MRNFIRSLLLAAMTLVIAVILGGLAAAAPPERCDDRDRLVGWLAEKFGERPIALGLTDRGGLMEILKAASGRSWSIIVTSPDGQSCLVAAGSIWSDLARPADDPSS